MKANLPRDFLQDHQISGKKSIIQDDKPLIQDPQKKRSNQNIFPLLSITEFSIDIYIPLDI